MRRAPNVKEATQASLFVDALRHAQPGGMTPWRGKAEVDELQSLAERFLGVRRAQFAFARFAHSRGVAAPEELPADAETVHFAETLLAGAIGSASARVMVASVTSEEPVRVDEVLHILDEASQIRAYSHQLEQKSAELEAATRELQAANERLKELDRVKDDFMSSVTHELRTPLASIRAFSEILYDDPEIDLAQRKRFLGIIVGETKRLSRLVNQVLDLAKIESGHADWRTEDVDLVTLIEQATEATEQLFSEHGARVSRDLPVFACVVSGDRDRLMQVLVNLLSNAVKFTPEGEGQVRIALTDQDQFFQISVSDNGCGIDPDDQAEIFDRFRQGGGGEQKPVGTGLGLPISRQIIEHLGGKIWVESVPQNGATFIFRLPRKASGQHALGETDAEEGLDRR
jgi:signal transduction histidine kinase